MVNGQVVLKYDLGSGSAVITNPVNVSNNQWYYIEAKRFCFLFLNSSEDYYFEKCFIVTILLLQTLVC